MKFSRNLGAFRRVGHFRRFRENFGFRYSESLRKSSNEPVDDLAAARSCAGGGQAVTHTAPPRSSRRRRPRRRRDAARFSAGGCLDSDRRHPGRGLPHPSTNQGCRCTGASRRLSLLLMLFLACLLHACRTHLDEHVAERPLHRLLAVRARLPAMLLLTMCASAPRSLSTRTDHNHG